MVCTYLYNFFFSNAIKFSMITIQSRIFSRRQIFWSWIFFCVPILNFCSYPTIYTLTRIFHDSSQLKLFPWHPHIGMDRIQYELWIYHNSLNMTFILGHLKQNALIHSISFGQSRINDTSLRSQTNRWLNAEHWRTSTYYHQFYGGNS